MRSGRMLTVVTILVVCQAFYGVYTIAPKCLDFRSPFRPNSSLTFCSEYSEIACCGESDEALVKEHYDYIQTKVTESDWNNCRDYLKEILCTKCSPFATVLYEVDGSTSKFPGLCNDYCETFYDNCRSLLWFIDPTLATQSLVITKSRFCSRTASHLPNDSYCYPDVVQNHLSSVRDSIDEKANNYSLSCVCVEKIRSRLANPVFARPAYDGSGRVFVAEQVGKVHIYNPRKNSWNSELFLDMRSVVEESILTFDERGFYGLAFHPNFTTNGRIFMSYYRARNRNEPLPEELQGLPYLFRGKLTISEIKPLSSNPDKGDTSTERVILEVPQPVIIHNGGEFFFGEDNYLYVLVSDGGGAGDPLRSGQNKSLLYGSILRLDVDSDPSQPYTIPDDNPFLWENGSKPEIYAYGIRNMWRCGKDPGDRETGESKGRVLCGDVGQSRYEEINVLKKGANYGWNSREGLECYNVTTCGRIGEEELPIVTYSHAQGLSVIGGVFYRGCQSPNLNGLYIYGDYSSRRLWTLESSGANWTNADLNYCDESECQGNLQSTLTGFILSFGEDEDGETYVLTSDSSSSLISNGYMFKLVDPSWRKDPTTCESDTNASKRVPLPSRRQLWVWAYNIQRRFNFAPGGNLLIRKLLKRYGL